MTYNILPKLTFFVSSFAQLEVKATEIHRKQINSITYDHITFVCVCVVIVLRIFSVIVHKCCAAQNVFK